MYLKYIPCFDLIRSIRQLYTLNVQGNNGVFHEITKCKQQMKKHLLNIQLSQFTRKVRTEVE